MPFLSSVGDVTELYLGTEGVELDESNPENRFRLDWLTTVEEALDEVAAEPTRPLVITATGKFFTNGLDTDHILAAPKALPEYLDRVHALFSKVLTLPVPTVAAINGHAFGAGAMLALCADYRLMRAERGFWSLPEVALGMPFPLGMSSLLRTRLPDQVATEAMLTARRYSAADAHAGGIVEEAVGIDSLLARAREVAAERAPLAGPNLGEVKRNLRQPLIADLQIAYPRTVL
ncbi:enoyl-CoA hydratase/isomerase family protein [Gordonia sp. HNM0687]|uniref:Enoyl-CoA hydratase/isomerase family protein n=1 Tax=Gordonia mangrovi TaxID=2665643 RepID=A0A6L7GWU8_9ACTN|nr:enoyl-CoA hydratase/isomerase family protein [Gordonia mangrovi]MXP23095.1 enoyl-CoA hydratase/isomerase family protein [Gordonia mangrovi]UVF77382.1 enoyl-CoA hydratase/isomerase family protein [Gordonia mangrovi]